MTYELAVWLATKLDIFTLRVRAGRRKSGADTYYLDAAYLLAGHIDIKMTRRVYDRNIRMVEPLR